MQIGENFSLVHDMERALAAQACDYVMPDLERIGGVTGWRRAAELAAAKDMKMSSHLYPEVSAHLLAATPTAHWLEYVDWANAIVRAAAAHRRRQRRSSRTGRATASRGTRTRFAGTG